MSASPGLDLDAVYIETAFARRLGAALDEAKERHTSHLIAALPGAGKSTLLDDYRASHPVMRRHDGTTSAPVIVGEPANDSGRSAKGFCESLLRNYGTVPSGSEATQTERLITQVVECGTGLIATDDMHVARPDDLMLLKRVIDGVRKQSGRIVPVVMLCAGTPGRPPLWEVVNRKSLEWEQFRRRLAPTDPWIFVASLSAREVREVLVGYEQGVLRDAMPGLRLARWWERIAKHLSHSFFLRDGEAGDRVTMQNVRNLVGEIVGEMQRLGLADIPPDGSLVDAAAARLHGSPEPKVREADPGQTEVQIAAGGAS